jgi:hypothetical protein
MASSLPPRLRWLFPATFVALAAVSAWAFLHMPPPNLLGHARVYNSVTLAAPVRPGEAMCLDWTMHLRFDPSAKPPGPRWILHEGKQVGDGYELRWIPEKLGLQVYRAPDQFLLGTVRLGRMPRTIDFIRRGAWFRALADGVDVLTCLDPMGLPDPSAPKAESQAWGCWTTGSDLGEAEITLIDDRVAAPSGEPAAGSFASRERRDLDAIARVRAALSLTSSKQQPAALGRAVGSAAV